MSLTQQEMDEACDTSRTIFVRQYTTGTLTGLSNNGAATANLATLAYNEHAHQRPAGVNERRPLPLCARLLSLFGTRL